MNFLVNILVRNMTPRSLIQLGDQLIAAGNAALARQDRIEHAIQTVRAAHAALEAERKNDGISNVKSAIESLTQK